MGYLSCNVESAISTCDPYNWDRKKRSKSSPKSKPTNPIRIREFSYADLVTATNSFSAESFLGKGSHGSVYKAVLDDGKLVAAVKRTTFSNPTTANCAASPSENEIEILSRVQNPSLVNLIGVCTDSKERKLIVVEYMPNGCLYDVLHSSFRPPGWTRRVRFALQIAKAVQALHCSNPPVIHRDIKSSNVLIDEHFNARLGDFGLALRGHVEDVRVKCTPPAGTLGYLDPGYLAPGDLSTKSDVFSFGILLLEIISGRNAIDVNYSPPSVVDWAVPLIKHGEFSGICDRRIGAPADPAVIRHLAVLAARCVRSTAEKRPSMADAVECLKIVRKKVHAPPIWSSFRRRVKRVEKTHSEMFAGSEEEAAAAAVKSSRSGSRRNRKVSSVTSIEHPSDGLGSVGGSRVIKSKSIGSFSEILKVEPDSKIGSGQVSLGKRKGGVAVKMKTVRLSKSRSMGVLQSPRLVQFDNGKGGFVLEFGGSGNPRDLHQLDMSKLVISLEKKSQDGNA